MNIYIISFNIYNINDNNKAIIINSYNIYYL